MDRRIGVFDDELATSARSDEAARRTRWRYGLLSVPGSASHTLLPWPVLTEAAGIAAVFCGPRGSYLARPRGSRPTGSRTRPAARTWFADGRVRSRADRRTDARRLPSRSNGTLYGPLTLCNWCLIDGWGEHIKASFLMAAMVTATRFWFTRQGPWAPRAGVDGRQPAFALCRRQRALSHSGRTWRALRARPQSLQ